MIKISSMVGTPDLKAPVLAPYSGDLPAAFDKLVRLGYEGVEFMTKNPSKLNGAAIRRSLDEHNLELCQICTGHVWGEDKLGLVNTDATLNREAMKRMKEIVDFAAEHGVACSIGSNLELDVATAAMAHLVIGCPNMQVERYPGDMLGPDYHQVRIAKNPIQIEGPMTTISNRPGLGVEVDWDLVRQFACD